MRALLVVLTIVTTSACPTPKPISYVVDCAVLEGKADWPTIVQALTPDLIARDWGKLILDVETLGGKYGYDVARCVGMQIIAEYLSVKQTGEETVTWKASDAAEKIRATAAGKSGNAITFHTRKYGDI